MFLDPDGVYALWLYVCSMYIRYVYVQVVVSVFYADSRLCVE